MTVERDVVAVDSRGRTNTQALKLLKISEKWSATFALEAARLLCGSDERREVQEGKSPSSLLFQPISPSSLLFREISPFSLNLH